MIRTTCAATLLLAIVPAIAQPAGTEPAAMAEVAVTELSFPRHITTSAGRLVIHAPQIEAWPDYQRVIARSAIEVTLAGSDQAAPGTLMFEGNTRTNLAERVVGFFDLRVTGLNFPGVDAATVAKLDAFTRNTVSRGPKKVPLDLVLAYLEDKVVPPGDRGLTFDPPRIFYSSKPAVLVVLDGTPVKVPIKGIGLSYAANTNWDLFWLGAESRWYLLNDRQWLVSRNQDLDGQWKRIDKLPSNFRSLPLEDDWKDVLANVPPPQTKQKTPIVFVSQTPAELILTDGRADFAKIEGLELRYATNTASDLFLLDETYYYLVSGRWFSTANLKEGPWFAVTTLPTVFAGIPKTHARARVRVAIPGTDEARLAALEAAIPRTATIKAGTAPQVKVTYNGAPQFEAIPGTTLARAVNTPYDVIRYGAAFYLCYNATWYASDSAEGPWRVAPKVPDEIYKIPPSSPAYHVTHVKIYASDAETVTTGYTGGYYGVYSTGTTVVYGTGFYYPPYLYYGAMYPYYYYYPMSYGRGSYYNPATGAYGGAEAIYGPYGGAGRAAVYNPQTGSYARGRAVWDDDEMAGQAIGYNPRTGTGVATHRYRTEDSYWGETVVRRGDDWVYTQSEWQNGSGSREFATSGGLTGSTNREISDGQITGSGSVSRGERTASGEMVRTEQGVAREITTGSGETIKTARGTGSDDLYAAKDGSVYKRTDDGWQKYENGAWQSPDRGSFQEQSRQAAAEAGRNPPAQGSPSQRPSTADRSPPSRAGFEPGTADRSRDLDRDYRARRDGYGQFNERRSAGRAAGGGMRGGGMRGGGGRRR